MDLDNSYTPEYESVRELLVQMALEPSVDQLLQMVAEKMSTRPHVAKARIWLINPGDRCRICIRSHECPDRTECLHLFATGNSPGIMDKLTGQDDEAYYDRVPLGIGDIGRVGTTGKLFQKERLESDPLWLSHNCWAEGLGFMAVGAYPLMHKDEVMGVIALYPRIRLARITEGYFWLRMMGNLAGFAVANAKAIAQIEHLKSQLELENAYLREEIDQAQAFGDIVGSSPPLLNILKQVELVSPTDATVLIWGESGTGKELIAREIHKLSRRRERPMIKVNCAAIPDSLYESEFFGHVKGAFTGAVKDRAGRFQAADGGTLFLDEIGEIPLALQGKLLRVIQEGAYERVGEDRTRKVDVRIIVATNRDIKQDVASHRFREDLYYRLSVFPIEVVPLRKRKQDIIPLVEHFLRLSAKKMAKPLPRLTRDHMTLLKQYDWPGNIRELQNVVDRAIITSHNGSIFFDVPALGVSRRAVVPGRSKTTAQDHGQIATEAHMKENMQQNILAALNQCRWKIYGQDGAAALLGIKPTTLSSRMKRMDIRKESATDKR